MTITSENFGRGAEDESSVVLHCTTLLSDVEAREHILDFAMAIVLKLMQAMYGPERHPIEVRIAATAGRSGQPGPFKRVPDDPPSPCESGIRASASSSGSW
jgi:hypothetical protein